MKLQARVRKSREFRHINVVFIQYILQNNLYSTVLYPIPESIDYKLIKNEIYIFWLGLLRVNNFSSHDRRRQSFG